MRNGLVISNTTIATEESRIYEGISERNLSYVQQFDAGCDQERNVDALVLLCPIAAV